MKKATKKKTTKSKSETKRLSVTEKPSEIFDKSLEKTHKESIKDIPKSKYKIGNMIKNISDDELYIEKNGYGRICKIDYGTDRLTIYITKYKEDSGYPYTRSIYEGNAVKK